MTERDRERIKRLIWGYVPDDGILSLGDRGRLIELLFPHQADDTRFTVIIKDWGII